MQTNTEAGVIPSWWPANDVDRQAVEAVARRRELPPTVVGAIVADYFVTHAVIYTQVSCRWLEERSQRTINAAARAGEEAQELEDAVARDPQNGGLFLAADAAGAFAALNALWVRIDSMRGLGITTEFMVSAQREAARVLTAEGT